VLAAQNQNPSYEGKNRNPAKQKTRKKQPNRNNVEAAPLLSTHRQRQEAHTPAGLQPAGADRSTRKACAGRFNSMQADLKD